MKQDLKSVNAELRCVRLTPTEDTKKSIADLKTIALSLTKAQADALASALKNATAQGLETILVTGHRKPMKDGQYRMTVTGRMHGHRQP